MERQLWVNVDSPIIHILILVFSKHFMIKVLSHMYMHNNLLNLDLYS